MKEFVEFVLGPLIVHLLNYLWRKRQQLKFRGGIETNAKQKLADPNVPVTDPTVATELALIEAYAKPLEKITRAVSKSIPPTISQTKTGDIITAKIPRPGSHSDGERDPGKSG